MQQREQKTEIVTIRVTPSQKLTLERAAAGCGLSVSALLLLNGLQAARKVASPALAAIKAVKARR